MWLLLLLLLLCSSVGRGVACLCAPAPPGGLLVNCSGRGLAAVPGGLPADTAELHLQANRLTAVSPGAFDRLGGLRRVWLSGNPFHCDCGVRYLRDWLLRNTATGGGVGGAEGGGGGVDVAGGSPRCATPSSLARREIVELGEDVFAPCAAAAERSRGCAGSPDDLLLLLLLLCVILLLLWSLRLAKDSSITLDIVRKHCGLDARALRSRRPKHRTRLHSATSEASGDSAAPLWTDDHIARLNMEILPQILDVLHKKHNIKIKAS